MSKFPKNSSDVTVQQELNSVAWVLSTLSCTLHIEIWSSNVLCSELHWGPGFTGLAKFVWLFWNSRQSLLNLCQILNLSGVGALENRKVFIDHNCPVMVTIISVKGKGNKVLKSMLALFCFFCSCELAALCFKLCYSEHQRKLSFS